jgi:bisphosphoglycerate-independent phosphoglycerate mutase (AlkP superfamily)
MVGHTGDMEATTRACALVDSCVKELLAAVDAVGGRWLVRHGCGARWRVAPAREHDCELN